MRVHGLAPVEPAGVDGDDEDVVEEVLRALAVPEALAVDVEQRAGLRPCFVRKREDHRPVLHGDSREQLS